MSVFRKNCEICRRCVCVMVLALNWRTLAGKGFPLTQQLYVKVRGNDFKSFFASVVQAVLS